MTIQNAMLKFKEIAHPITANHSLKPEVELERLVQLEPMKV